MGQPNLIWRTTQHEGPTTESSGFHLSVRRSFLDDQFGFLAIRDSEPEVIHAGLRPIVIEAMAAAEYAAHGGFSPFAASADGRCRDRGLADAVIAEENVAVKITGGGRWPTASPKLLSLNNKPGETAAPANQSPIYHVNRAAFAGVF